MAMKITENLPQIDLQTRKGCLHSETAFPYLIDRSLSQKGQFISDPPITAILLSRK